MSARYVYDPFGNVLAKSGPLADANTYRFSSQEYHQPSGLLLYMYRPYDPNLQRFLNRDPIQELGGLNLYGLVGNSPVAYVDPFGLDWASWPFIGPVISNAQLNDFARRLQDREGNYFRDNNDAMRYMNERNHRSNLNNWQSGDLGAVRVCADLTSAIANTYLIAATAVTLRRW